MLLLAIVQPIWNKRRLLGELADACQHGRPVVCTTYACTHAPNGAVAFTLSCHDNHPRRWRCKRGFDSRVGSVMREYVLCYARCLAIPHKQAQKHDEDRGAVGTTGYPRC